MLFGLKFKHPAFALSFTGKTSGKNFYSPYSSGNKYAERACMVHISVRPLRKFILGCSFLSEKKISTGYYESYLPFTRREQVYLSYKFTKNNIFKVKLNYVEKSKDNGRENSLQIKSSLKLSIAKILKLSFSAAYQKKKKGSSIAINPGLSISFLYYVNLSLYYSKFFISKDNSFYSVVSPYRDSITRGSFVDESSNLVTARLAFKYKKNMLSVRYQHEFLIERSIKYRIEVSGRVVF